MLSIGGDDNMTSLPLGAYFVGSSLISLTVTPWLFTKFGRRAGFLMGIGWGLLGTAIGAASIATSSPALLIVASGLFGVASGIGFFWRFAAVEVVPAHFAARAVTLVVSGGCIAAFAGPESAQATQFLFGDDLEYMGVFLMTGIFCAANIVFTLLVQFPPTPAPPSTFHQEEQETDKKTPSSRSELSRILWTRQFIVPMLISTMSWAMMAVPMSLVRVAMGQVGFTSRQSLTTIELHFLGMYAPGFFTGSLIQRYGPRAVCSGAIVLYAVALILMLVSEEEEDRTYSIVTWTLGLISVGMGWNFGFTSATVWLTELYKAPSRAHLKTSIQAANDCLMFGLAGGWIFSASYIFDAGGSGLDGWKLLNFVVVGLLAFTTILLLVNHRLESMAATASTNTREKQISVDSDASRDIGQTTVIVQTSMDVKWYRSPWMWSRPSTSISDEVNNWLIVHGA
jgi:MFS family permease